MSRLAVSALDFCDIRRLCEFALPLDLLRGLYGFTAVARVEREEEFSCRKLLQIY